MYKSPTWHFVKIDFPVMKIITNRFALSVAVFSSVTVYYFFKWKTVTAMVHAIIDGPYLLADFVRVYYPMARTILFSSEPAPGFYYSAFCAILLSPIGLLNESLAFDVWFCFQFFSLAALFLIPAFSLPSKNSPYVLPAYTLLFITSFPVFHNFIWGQFSACLTAMVLGAVFLYHKGYGKTSAALMGLAVSLKYYLAIAAIYYLAKKDVKTIIWLGFILFLFLALIPAVVLGPGEAYNFQKISFRELGSLSSYAKLNFNSQYFAHVFFRLTVDDWKNLEYSHVLVGFSGLVVVALNMILVWLMINWRTQFGNYLGLCLVFLSTPFLTPTSWPHYFVFLPFCQLVFWLSVCNTLESWKKSLLILVFLAPSIALSNMVPFLGHHGWIEVAFQGRLFFSSLFLLFGIYALLIINSRLNGNTAQLNRT